MVKERQHEHFRNLYKWWSLRHCWNKVILLKSKLCFTTLFYLSKNANKSPKTGLLCIWAQISYSVYWNILDTPKTLVHEYLSSQYFLTWNSAIKVLWFLILQPIEVLRRRENFYFRRKFASRFIWRSYDHKTESFSLFLPKKSIITKCKKIDHMVAQWTFSSYKFPTMKSSLRADIHKFYSLFFCPKKKLHLSIVNPCEPFLMILCWLVIGHMNHKKRLDKNSPLL